MKAAGDEATSRRRAARFAAPLAGFVRDLARGDSEALAGALPLLADGERLTEIEHHHLAGYVYLRLREAGLLERVAPEPRRRLREYYTRQWLRTERLLFELRGLQAACAAAGLPLLLLKGPGFAQRYYGRWDCRASSDIDLLVRPRDLERACEIVQRCGFDLRSWMPYGQLLARRFVHHIEFAKGGLPLDLHHVARSHPAFRLDEEPLWASALPLALCGLEIRVPDDAHALLFLLLSIHQDLGIGTLTLRQLLDLFLLLRALGSGFDWAGFAAARRRDGTWRICLNVLSLCLRAFGAETDHPEASRLLAENARELLIPSGGDLLALFREYRFFRNKYWCFRLYPGSLAVTLGWWLAGLPVRYTAYRSTSLTRVLAKRYPG